MICDTRRTLLRDIAGLDLGETPRARKASKIIVVVQGSGGPEFDCGEVLK
jgi:hypothetical protein